MLSDRAGSSCHSVLCSGTPMKTSSASFNPTRFAQSQARAPRLAAVINQATTGSQRVATSKLLVCQPHRLRPVGLLQPPHDEVAARHVLVVADEDRVDDRA